MATVSGKEAELYDKLPNGRTKCTACARLCEIPEGKTGLCGIRGVVDINYGYLYMVRLLQAT
jgi:pyruvate formate lyase activating enzyme